MSTSSVGDIRGLLGTVNEIPARPPKAPRTLFAVAGGMKVLLVSYVAEQQPTAGDVERLTEHSPLCWHQLGSSDHGWRA